MLRGKNMNRIKEGLIYTNDNCIGCNRCISVCSCPGATVASESSDGTNIINIDSSRCITCGACFDACEHKAREFTDDTAEFFSSLADGEDISVLIAPAFFANYPDEHKVILGKLRSLGVNRMINVSFGADITTWAYLNYLSEHHIRGCISQPCPAVVDYIEKYAPELISKLIPVQSPMMCAAIYSRRYLGVSGKIAFIGPCIAKKNEIMSERGKGIISYNVTFDHMMKYLRSIDIAPQPYEIETDAGLGSVYPMIGGLADNISHFLGKKAFVRQVSGESQMAKFFEYNKERIISDDCPYFMIDALNCSDGCLCGTGVEADISTEDTLIRMMEIKDRINGSRSDVWSGISTPSERFAALNRHFEKLDINDYLCSYNDRSEGHAWKVPSEKELDIVFDNMNKTTEESRQINCSSCGYNSCREMAEAVYNGYNHKENCIHFIKDMLEEISAERPTVIVIHEKDRSVNVVKYTGEDAIRSWIQSGLNLIDYNRAIKNYIDRYVDAADRDRLWAEVEFSALEHNLSFDNHFSIIYTRHPEKGDSGYFQLEFTRLEGRNNIVLSFRDVDKMVRDDIEKRNALQQALNNAKREYEIVQSLSEIYYVIYIIDLKTFKFEEIKSPRIVADVVDKYTDARKCLAVLPEIMFEAENLSEIKAFYDPETWADRLSKTDFCSFEARGRVNGWVKNSLISAERDSEGRPVKVIFALQNINKEKEQSLKNYAIISGLSVEYSTLWLIDEKDRKIRLERSNHNATLDIHSSESLARWMDYDYAMSSYINNFVHESDKERISRLTEFDMLIKSIPETNVYTINFLKVSGDVQRHNQMVFIRTKDEYGNGKIVLAYRDIDSFVREEQIKEKKLEDALLAAEQANRAKSTFLANMSHEIRTPINAILGMDTMILRESREKNILEYARNVKSASDTLLSLINDILDFSKIESGKMEVIVGQYRLDSVVNDLMNMVRGKAEDKGLELILEIQPQTPVLLCGDEIRLKQIILNLLNNAVKYTRSGTITFSVGYEEISTDEILLCISVRDTGIGIRQEDMQKLFSPYERLDENVNKYIEGTGLGLSITRNLLEKMGSRLEVDSVYGEGSTFSCRIRQPMWGNDRMDEDSLVLADTSAEEISEVFHAPDADILVVDDVAMNITVITNLLKRSQIIPEQCLSGKEAVKCAAEKKYDIIFLDAMMPEMSGEDTLRAIRESCPINDDTPIIVLTANAIVGAKEQYIEAGFTDYLSKPVDGIKLEKLIHHYLPSEKIIEVTVESGAAEETLSPKGAAILERIGKLSILSAEKGIEDSGGKEIYITVCRNFLDTSADRIRMISEYYEKGDIENYTIQVHALKSSARLIGAQELSESAYEMEMAGKDRKLKKIALMTPALIDQYKGIVQKLAEVFEINAETAKPKKELTSKKFRRRMTELMELVEAFDFKSASGLFNDLSDYALPDEAAKLTRLLRPLMADVKQDEIIDIIKNYLKEG